MRAAVNREDAPGAERGWLDWLSDCGVPAITGVDTRALVRHIRDAGAMRGGVFPAAHERGARRASGSRPSRRWPAWTSRARSRPAAMTEHGDGDGPRIAVDRHRHQGLDRAQPRRARRARRAAPVHGDAPTSCWPTTPTRSSWPTAPATPRRWATSSHTVRELVGKRPVWGICLGHQLLCQAVGLETYKLPFGHRGANHPVKDLRTGKIEITSQNHGFAVRGAGRRRARRGRRAGALGDRLRRRGADPRQPLRPHGRGPRAARGRRRAPSSTTPRPGPGPTTPCTCSTASWRPSVPRRDDLHKILILGSGPIVIGQAAEFDYSGVQACKVLRRRATRSSSSTPTRRRS